HVTAAAAASGQFGQDGNGSFRRSEAVDEVAKGRRANIVGTYQPEPVEPLPVGEAQALRRRIAHPFEPIFGSVPARSRSILARCVMKTMTLVAARMSACVGRPSR